MIPILKRAISAILCSALLFSAIPCTAAPENIPDDTPPETVTIPDGSYLPEALPSCFMEFSNSMTDEPDTLLRKYYIQPTLQSDTTELEGKEYYLNIEDAIPLLREQLQNWGAKCSVPVMIHTDDYIDFSLSRDEVINRLLDVSTPYIMEMIDLAEEHTGDPREGDYLAWNYYTYTYGFGTDAVITYSDYSQDLYMDLTFQPVFRTTAAEEAEFEAAAETLLDTLFGEERSTIHPYRTIRTIYDWVCANVTYDHKHLEEEQLYGDSYTYRYHYTAYAALINGTAVCQGYALLMYTLLLRMGIDCRFIAGLGNGGAHGWNIAEINGLYYNLDSTWDAGQTSYRYFMLNTADFTENYTDHHRYTQYETDAFHADYPMSETSYTYTQSEDVNGDGTVTAADAFYLLRYTLLPERYPLAVADADYTWNHRITAADASLLYSRYPNVI